MDEEEYDETEVIREMPGGIRMNYADLLNVLLLPVQGFFQGGAQGIDLLRSFLGLHSKAVDEAKERKRFAREAREDFERVI